MNELHPDQNMDVPDPWYGGEDGFEQVLNQCESSSKAWVNLFKQQVEQ